MKVGSNGSLKEDHFLISLLGVASSDLPSCGLLLSSNEPYKSVEQRRLTYDQIRTLYMEGKPWLSDVVGPDSRESARTFQCKDADSPVLLITNDNDIHADALVHFLNELEVPVVRWHPYAAESDYSIEVSERWAKVIFESTGKEVDLLNVRSCWYGRPDRVLNSSRNPSQRLANLEREALVWGLFERMKTTWYSHPYAMRQADFKVRQLLTAKQVGFKLPRYLITDDRQALIAFARTVGDVVVKPISEASKVVDNEGTRTLLLVKTFNADQLYDRLEVSLPSPVFAQEYVQKRFDVRVTAVGDELLSFSISIPGEASPVDWRREGYELKYLQYRPLDCPESVAQAIRTFMLRMNLNYGAFDFSVSSTGEWFFLECNPGGQWIWLDFETGTPLSEAIAAKLAEGER